MLQKIFITKLCAIMSVLFLFGFSANQPAEAKPFYNKCKVITGPATCQKTKPKATLVAWQKLKHLMNKNYKGWKVVKRKAYCKRRFVYGSWRWCCRIRAKICKRKLIKLPETKPPLFENPYFRQKHKIPQRVQ